MGTKQSRRLVIDASVARSCGSKEAIYPTSVNCRDFLLTALEVCHRVVMTPDLRQEWDKHQSRFAKEWLRQMIARKKLEALPKIETDKDLWSSIEKNAENDSQRFEMVKDLCLVEAAIATDQTIISLDETIRFLFSQVSDRIDILQAILWVNPDKPQEDCLEWLINGATPDTKRCLRPTADK